MSKFGPLNMYPVLGTKAFTNKTFSTKGCVISDAIHNGSNSWNVTSKGLANLTIMFHGDSYTMFIILAMLLLPKFNIKSTGYANGTILYLALANVTELKYKDPTCLYVPSVFLNQNSFKYPDSIVATASIFVCAPKLAIK